MSKRKLSTSEHRVTRSSGGLEPQRLLFTPKKRKKESQEIPSDTLASQDETVVSNPKEDIRLPTQLPDDLIPHFQVQKQAALRAFTRQNFTEPGFSSETKVFQQLKELIHGTVDRQEGNSCLILGPRGIGKTKLVEHCLSSFRTSTHSQIAIRLSGHSQINDRLAMREIVRQIREQSGTDVLLDPKSDNHVQDDDDTEFPAEEADLSLPPSSHLPQLINSLPSLGRPVIIVLDAFDKFTEHTRQALLYCLLDTVQSCRGALAGSNPRDKSLHQSQSDFTKRGTSSSSRKECGLLVVGVTSRVDCVNLLEKRVKSRFSHRILKMENSHDVPTMLQLFKNILTTDPGVDHMLPGGWQILWSKSIEDFVTSQKVVDIFEEIFMFSKDIRLYCRLLLSCLIALTPEFPWLTSTLLHENTITQRCPTQYPFLRGLPYPHLSLLIATMHTLAAGQDTFTFELLYDKFMKQVRINASAPVESEKGVINMPFISRRILFGAFEDLIDNHVFRPAIPYAPHISKEFMKYRSLAIREDIKITVDGLGQTAIKRWFYRNQ